MSDLDYYERLNPSGPHHEFCPHGVDLDEADCGACLESVFECIHGSIAGRCDDCRLAAVASDAPTLRTLDDALAVMLARIQRAEDETMGADLAARFERDRA